MKRLNKRLLFVALATLLTTSYACGQQPQGPGGPGGGPGGGQRQEGRFRGGGSPDKSNDTVPQVMVKETAVKFVQRTTASS